MHARTHAHTHTFNGPFLGLPRWAGTRKVKPIWILLKQERVSGSGISWAICKSAPRSRQITTPATHSVFYRPNALPAAQPTASKHWSQYRTTTTKQLLPSTSLCSASDVSWDHIWTHTAHICCWAPAVQQSINISWLLGPQQQTRDGWTHKQTDGCSTVSPWCVLC